MSVSQSLDNRWPVVSVPNGASSALDSIKNNIEYVSSFDKVIFAFDMDEPGQQAARTCAEFLPPGKAFIASFSLKDANEMIQEKKKQELVDALWQAAPVRPDDIVNARTINLKELSAKDDTKVYPFPWPELTKKMLGVRSGELTVITSGTGMGKSTVVREMIYDDLKNGRKVGAIMLEEGVVDTLHDLMALELEKPVRKILTLRKIQKQLPDVDLGVADELSDEEYNEAFESIAGSGNLFLYDHFGSMDPDVLLNKMYYMAKTLGCEKIYLDHISIVISGSDNDNERKEIDRMMTGLRSFVEECNVAVTTVSHLRKSNSTAPEEGGRVRMQDLRGSGSIAQLADVIFGCERNPQSTVEGQSDVLVIRSLKDRFGGFHGPAAALRYDRTTARCREIDNWTVDSNETIVIKEPEPEGVTI